MKINFCVFLCSMGSLSFEFFKGIFYNIAVMMRKYKVFLASSAELSMERKEIALMISRLNNAWVDKDIYLELVIWEELLQSFRGEGIQDYFNREMLKCDIVIVLFFKKVGQFTKEEFDKAYESLKKGKKPHFLFVYFKIGMIATDEVDEEILKVNQLKKEIQQHEQIYGSFNSIEDLTQKLRHQLELAILEKVGKPGWEKEAENLEMQRDDLENYKQHLAQKFKYLDFTGLNAILQKPMQLENIYVKLRAKESLSLERYRTIPDLKLLDAEGKALLKKKVEDFVGLFERLYHQKQEERLPLRMVILGHSGSGKTTLLKWLSLQCLKSKPHFFSQFIPLFIPLKDLRNDPDGTFRKKNIGTVIIELLKKENVLIDSFFERQFKDNRILFLFDGLDEIGDEKIRREVIHWIQKQYIGQNFLIVTSRFSGIHRASGLNFEDEIPVFDVQNFRMKDVEAFLKNWYRNVEIAIEGEQGTQKAIEEGEKKSGDLIGTIKKSKNLAELAVNPLLLTIIAIVHRTRAVLPRDRHKLYEECLKVMIELWNLANRRVDISFSFDNSMAHLAKIAVLLMDTNRREIDKKEIQTCCLPEKIEGQTREFFLKEMLLKAGLLFESEGKYGFLHLAFQEYLAAWHFANSKNQNDILKYHDRNYWNETLKLFVNIGNTEIFFEEITENLVAKEYWKYMRFWEQCIEEIVVEGVQKSVELNFAKKVIDILCQLKFKKKNEALINALYLHSPLYKHGKQLVKKGGDLFYNAPHPFVQSIGASILFRAEDETRKKLMMQLKKRVYQFEKKKDKSERSLLYFLHQNNNTFMLHVAGTQKVTDFHFTLARVKSSEKFVQYSTLLTLLDLMELLDLRTLRDLWDLWDLRDLRDLQDLLAHRDLLNFRPLLALLTLRDFLDLRKFRDFRYFRDLLDLWDPRDLWYLPFLHETAKRYLRKYEPILEKHQKEIIEWTDRAIEKLHGLSDRKLLKYFPNTTKEELKEFRENG